MSSDRERVARMLWDLLLAPVPWGFPKEPHEVYIYADKILALLAPQQEPAGDDIWTIVGCIGYLEKRGYTVMPAPDPPTYTSTGATPQEPEADDE